MEEFEDIGEGGEDLVGIPVTSHLNFSQLPFLSILSPFFVLFVFHGEHEQTKAVENLPSKLLARRSTRRNTRRNTRKKTR